MNEALITDALAKRASDLKLYGLLTHWNELDPHTPWVEPLIEWEEHERNRRGFERRVRNARIGHFKSLAEFDWQWPKHIDRQLISDQMQLDFVRTKSNIILLGGNGVGKTLSPKTLPIRPYSRGTVYCLPVPPTCSIH